MAKVIGVITADISISSMQDMISKVELSKGGNALLISKEGMYMAGKDKEAIMQKNIIEDVDTIYNKSGIAKELISGRFILYNKRRH